MALIKAYDRLGRGIDMSWLFEGFGYAQSGNTNSELVYADWLGGNTYFESYRYRGEDYRFVGVIYEEYFDGIVITSLEYQNPSVKPLFGLYGIDIFVSYDDLFYGSDGWYFDVLNERDKLVGNRFDDTLKGGPSNDKLIGKKGSDRLFGESGNDTLKGGSGKDKLVGGGGNDRLIGDGGSDVLIGSRGRDEFVINSTAGRDKIKRFDDRSDHVLVDIRGIDEGDVKLVDRRKKTIVKADGDTVAVVFGDELTWDDVTVL